MGQEELIEALWRKGEEKIAGLQKDAEKQAAAISNEFTGRLQEKRASCRLEQQTVKEGLVRKTALKAERQKRQCRARAKGELAERLKQIAEKFLPLLRDNGYDRIFVRLADEVRLADLDQVAVNPADVELAKHHFEGTEIVVDPAIAGGLRAIGKGGGLSIDNTFETRLRRLWQELLPQLIREIEEENG